MNGKGPSVLLQDSTKADTEFEKAMTGTCSLNSSLCGTLTGNLYYPLIALRTHRLPSDAIGTTHAKSFSTDAARRSQRLEIH
jgi:hypothetical protein